MDPSDIALRNETYGQFVTLGRAPTAGEIAGALGLPEGDVHAGWRRLHDGHALVLDAAGEIRMLNPFAAGPTPFRVDAAGRSWYANCGWDAFGIGSAMHVDSTIHTECADCHEPLAITVRDGLPEDTDLVFHVLVPAVSWWQDIGFT
ncbi:MAG: organomercurial lyase [Chloroflexota bacterium]